MAENFKNPNLREKVQNVGFDLDTAWFKSALWAASFLTATSAYLNFKSTSMYLHFNLGQYDRTPVVLVTISCVVSFFAAVSLISPAGYLFDLRRRPNPHWFAVASSMFMECGICWFWVHGKKLIEDVPTMVFATTMAVFLLCFCRAVAPGFGRRLPIVALYVATAISINIGRFWALIPYTAVVVYAQIFLEDYDKRNIILDP